MTLLPRSQGLNDRHSGRWWPVHMQGLLIAYVSCPNCGRVGTLEPPDHTIAPDGAVTPSLVCPYDCGYHEFVRLEDWTGNS